MLFVNNADGRDLYLIKPETYPNGYKRKAESVSMGKVWNALGILGLNLYDRKNPSEDQQPTHPYPRRA